MRMENLKQSIKTIQALAPKASADGETDNGAAVDARSYEQFNAGQVVIHVGAPTGTPDSFSIVYTLQHSDDNSSWSTAPKADTSAAGDATATVTAAGITTIAFEPGRLKRHKRLNRATTIVGGTSPTVPNGAVFQFGDSRKDPVS